MAAAGGAEAGGETAGKEAGGQPCCWHCGSTTTRGGSTTTRGHWRRHPISHQLLCNACGGYLDKHGQLPAAAVLVRRMFSAAEKVIRHIAQH